MTRPVTVARPATVTTSQLADLLGITGSRTSIRTRKVREYVTEGVFTPLNEWARADRWLFSRAAVEVVLHRVDV